MNAFYYTLPTSVKSIVNPDDRSRKRKAEQEKEKEKQTSERVVN